MTSVEEDVINNNNSECSVYSALPSETNVTMRDVFCAADEDDVPPTTDPNELIARNASEMIITFADASATLSERTAHDMSVYSVPESETNVTLSTSPAMFSRYSNCKSETNVTLRDAFSPCHDLRELNMSIYTTPASETNVTIPQLSDYSQYTAPKSETNITMGGYGGGEGASLMSQYTAPPSEVGVTMADGFAPCQAMSQLAAQGGGAYEWADEVTATGGGYLDNGVFDAIQEQLGIQDERIFGIEQSDGNVARCVDSIECLARLNEYQPIPLDVDLVMSTPKSYFNYNMRGVSTLSASTCPDSMVESMLLKTAESSSFTAEI